MKRVGLRVLLLLGVTLPFGVSCQAGKDPQLRVYAYYPLLSDGAPDSVEVSITHAERTWRFTSVDFTTSTQNHTPHTAQIPLVGAGPVEVSARLFVSGALASEGSISFAANGKLSWFVAVTRSDTGTSGGCFNCFGEKSFPISLPDGQTTAEAFWILWGGFEEGSGPY